MVRGLVVSLVVGVLAAAAAGASPPAVRFALSTSCGQIDDSTPVWAPGGRVIAFTRVTGSGGYSAVYRIRLDGKQLRLLSPESHYAYGPAWSPDGSQIAYSTFDLDAVVRIVVARADGTGPRVLATFQWQREPPATFLSWSPDGKELAYVGSNFPRSDLNVVRVAGNGTRVIAHGATQPTWSPDGRRIAYVGNTGITIVDAGGGVARVIADGGFPAWSPDGRRIAYETRSSVGVRVIDVDGSSDHEIDPRGSMPVWSPDGRRLADFTQAPQRSRSELHVVDLRSGRITTVSHDRSARFGADDFQPQFAPNGKTLAFTSASLTGVPTLGGSEIRLVRSNGGNERRLTYHCTVVEDGTGERIDGTWLPDLIVGSAGRDHIYGHGGADTIRARDGVRDTISCGPGRDTVFADHIDSVARDCESVRASGRPRR